MLMAKMKQRDIDFYKNFNNKFVKDLQQNHWDQSCAEGEEQYLKVY